MLRRGQQAPEFALPGAQGGTVETHRFSDYADNGWVTVLAFYPFDFHPACITQLCSLRDADWFTLLDGVAVLGISTDSVHSHRAFGEAERIDFPLLSDSDGSVARAYGVLAEELDDHRDVAEPAMFVIDPDRVVQFAWTGEGPDDRPDVEVARKAVNCRDGSCDVPDSGSLPSV